MQTYDFAIIGGGILGASFASALLAGGRSVILFERWTQPADGSVRNFGLVWPFIVPGPDWVPFGLRSLEIYRSLADRFDFDWSEAGALLAATTPGEAAVTAEFVGRAAAWGMRCELLDADAAIRLQPLLRPGALHNAVLFPGAGALNPRRFVGGWLNHLAERDGLRLETPRNASVIAPAGRGLFWVVAADSTEVQVRDVLVCTGEDFQTLFPRDFRTSGLRRCKLQMMQTTPLAAGGPAMAFGRSLRHYPLFQQCPSFAGLESEPGDPDLDRWGIHLLVKAVADGSLVLGDSHEDRPGDAPRDFDYHSEVEDCLLALAQRHLALDAVRLQRRWLGYYARHPSLPIVDLRPGQRLRLLTGLTCGMSAAPGFAEDRVREWLEYD